MNHLLLGYVVWKPAVGFLMGTVLFMAICGCLVLSYWRIQKRYSGRKLAMLFTPRVILAILLLLLMFDPHWVIVEQLDEDLRFLLLQDTSVSMEVADRKDTPRSERTGKAADTLRSQLPGEVEVRERRFVDGMLPKNDQPGTGEEEADDSEQNGGGEGGEEDTDEAPAPTDLAQVLVDVTETHRAQNFDGVVLFTDGGDDEFRVGEPPPVPVYPFVAGSEAGDHDDLVIEQVDAPDNVETETDFTVSAVLQPYGSTSFLQALGRHRIRLQKRSSEDGEWETMDEKEVQLKSGGKNVELTVDGLSEVGQQRMRVIADSLSGELTDLNNQRKFSIDVRQTALSVLLFTTSPGQHETILRRTLEGDPGIAVTSLIRLRGDRYLVQRSDQEDAPDVDGFPTSADQLLRFDVAVIGSFPAKMWKRQQMDALVEYVSEGGAAVFLGGTDAFGRGGYVDTAIDPLFPWKVRNNEPELDVGRRGVTASPSILRQQLIRGWAEKLKAAHPLHIYSLNRPGELRAGATELLLTSSNEGEQPVIAVQSYGRGRVMSTATNTLWRWRTEGGNKRAAYNHFWRQGLRYLAGKDQQSGLLRVNLDRNHYYPGEAADIEVTVAGEFKEGSLRVDGRWVRGDDEESFSLERRGGSVNRFLSSITFPERGTYDLRFTAYNRNQQIDTSETTVKVGARLNEGARIYPDYAFLDEVASMTGGTSFREGQEEQLREELMSLAERPQTRRMEPLIQRWGIYLVLVILTLLAEWIIRRRMNLF